MKLKLKSNFFELWHAAFDSEGLEFRLMTNEGPNRIEMFNLFRKLGILTPLFGKHGDFIRFKYDVDRYVVIYDDINMHFGEKKRLVRFRDIVNEDKNKYMSEYIENIQTLFTDYISKSTRLLCVGDACFQYDYRSYTDWRSNNGRVFISDPIRVDLPRWRHEVSYPMFAIDFVGEPHCLRAIDFNCAPGVTGVKLGLSSSEMVLLIKMWYAKYFSNKETDGSSSNN